MSALVEMYLRDYYELSEGTSINDKLLSKIDLDMAIDALQDSFTDDEWLIFEYLKRGYLYKDVIEQVGHRYSIVIRAYRAICNAIAHHLGWEYSNQKIYYMVAKRLKVVRLSKEEYKFVQLKLENHSNRRLVRFNIHNFAFDKLGRLVMRE